MDQVQCPVKPSRRVKARRRSPAAMAWRAALLLLASLTAVGCDGCDERDRPVLQGLSVYDCDGRRPEYCVPRYPYSPGWQPSGPTLDIRDLGAVGDGATNDTQAFQAASQQLQDAGSGTLIIPAGTYLVGQQEHVEGSYPYWKEANIFSVSGLDGLVIEGEEGAVVRLADAQRYGAFDPDTGEPFEAGVLSDHDYAANSGRMFVITNSTNVIVRNLEIDGNNETLIIGGRYGDVGIQLPNDGLRLFDNSNVLVQDVYTHHHGRDGIMLSYDGVHPHLFEGIVSEYNGRQGLSWIGGTGLTVKDSAFNHTGRGAIGTAPQSGVDIESETAIIREGLFCGCEFINNVSAGMIADSGDSADLRFEQCLFWGTSYFPVWNDKPNSVYVGCTFHGPVQNKYGASSPCEGTRYYDCHFEDVRWEGYDGDYLGRFLVEYDSARENILFDGCSFVANELRPFWLTRGSGAQGWSYLSNCTVTNRKVDNPDGWTSVIGEGWHLENVSFMEDFPEDFDKTHFIYPQGARVGEGVVVDGPYVGFTGQMLFGEIEPGLY